MMKRGNITISLLHYKAYQELRSCLDSLQQIKKLKNFTLTIVVVDNESNSKQLKMFQKEFPHIIFLPQKENIGVPSGFNVGYRFGLEHAADYLMMYSPDLRIKNDALIKLIQVMEKDKEIGIACCKMVTKTNPSRICFVEGKLDQKTKTTIHVGYGEVDRGQYDKTSNNDFLNCPMVIRRNVFERVGYFTDELFQYYEDTDWHTRIKKAGFKLVCVMDSIAWNLSADIDSKVLPKKEYYLARNHLWFVRHNFSLPEQLIAYVYTLKDALLLFFKNDGGSKKRKLYVYMGIMDFFLNKMGRKKFRK